MNRESGQATVELALLLPLVALLLLGVVQVAVVASRQVAVTHAAREAGRAAAAGASEAEARQAALAASSLDPERVTVVVVHQNGGSRATVTFREPTDVPLVGVIVPSLDLTATLSFRDEPKG